MSRVTNPDARRAAAAARSRTAAAAAAILAWEKRYAFAARRASGGDASGVQTIALILDDWGWELCFFWRLRRPRPSLSDSLKRNEVHSTSKSSRKGLESDFASA